MQTKSLSAEVLNILKELLPQCNDENVLEYTFTQLGGDSLLGMQFVGKIYKELNVNIKLETLLGEANIMEILTHSNIDIETSPQGREQIVSIPFDDTLTSTTQKGIWMIQELINTNKAYNLNFNMAIKGPINLDLFIKNISGMVKSFDNLKSVFNMTEEGLKKNILKDFEAPLEIVNIQESVDAEFNKFANQYVKSIRESVSFNITKDPPILFKLITNRQDKHMLIMFTHHIILDGWSIGLFFKELIDRYYGHGDPALNNIPFADYEKQITENGSLNYQLNHWKEVLKNYPSVLEIKSENQRLDSDAFEGQRIAFDIGVNKTKAIKHLAKELGITPFSIMLSAYSILLRRYSGEKRFLIGVPTAGRPTVELQKYMGLCSNVVPVLFDFEESHSLKSFLKYNAASLRTSLANSDVPLLEIVKSIEVSRDSSKNPLIQFVFAMHDKLINREITTQKNIFRIYDGHGGGSPFDLTFFIQESSPSYKGEIEFSTNSFSLNEVERFLDSYLSIINDILGGKINEIDEIRGISLTQKALLEEVNNDLYDQFLDEDIFSAFKNQVLKTPNKIAVDTTDGKKVTYENLLKLSNIQSDLLLTNNIKPLDNILIGIDRSLEEIIALLGILQIGATYVPIDLSWPTARINKIIEEANPTAIISNNLSESQKKIITNKNIKLVNSFENSWHGKEVKKSFQIIQKNKNAYISFTSGTTGTPKGVLIPEIAVLRLVKNNHFITLNEGDRFLRFAPLAFDASTLEIWGPLLNGGTCVVYPTGIPNPNELGQFIKEQDIKTLWLTSGLFSIMAEFIPECFVNVQQVLTGGDVVSPEHVSIVKKLNPKIVIINGYGPTENTTFTTTYRVESFEDITNPLPIGKPINNTNVYVLDENFGLLPPGAVGELYVGGAGLSAGYLNNMDETKMKFSNFSPYINKILYRTGDLVRFDVNYNLQFYGRKDTQVKIRGHRIEIKEIELQLTKLSAIKKCVVFATVNDSVNKKLIAAVVMDNEKSSMLKVKDSLRKILPDYMIPTLWVKVDEFPLNQNGKIDKGKLENLAKKTEIDFHKENINEPYHLELQNMLQNILELEYVNLNDDFFNIGGDSLKLVQLISLVQKELNVKIPLKEYYADPTLKKLIELTNSKEEL